MERRLTRSSSRLSTTSSPQVNIQKLSNTSIKKLTATTTAFAESSIPTSQANRIQVKNSNSEIHGVKDVKRKALPSSKQAPKKKRQRRFRVAYTNRKAVKLLSQSGNNELSTDSISFLTNEEKLLLSSWGLPSPVLSRYRQKGVTTLFQWQLDCLDNEKVLKGCNILYSAPTSAGKTLVAEILMVKRVLELGKKAIMILPFVSVAREKMYSLQELFGDIGIRVEGFMGTYNPPGGFQQVDIAVCTIEKANSLINRLLEEDTLSQLGTIVVDELHLIGDPGRGYLLELLLTKIRFAFLRSQNEDNASHSVSNYSQNQNSLNDESENRRLNIQIIGMSATLPNLTTLAGWLEAELVMSDYRPVPLVEQIKIGDSLYDSSLVRIGPILKEKSHKIPNDEDHIVSLTLETILDGHSTLIFCPSKQMCERMAVQISEEFQKIGNPNSSYMGAIGEKLRPQIQGHRIIDILTQLQQCPAGIDEVLKRAISFGVAFHHAGLTFDERDIIESAFKRGILRVIVATSTLSAGVNLPARRVLIVTPTFDGLDVLTYRQMSGRAGRKGVDTKGESILVSNLQTQKRAVDLIQAKIPAVSSALIGSNGTVTRSMKRALLEAIASGVVQSHAQVKDYANCTLLTHLATNQPHEDSSFSQTLRNDTIEKGLEFLSKNDFIRYSENCDTEIEGKKFETTKLGSACLASSLSPDEGILVFKELEKARKCFVLENELHVIYQVTPIYLAEQWRNLDWTQYMRLWDLLTPDQQSVGRLIGISESFIIRCVVSGVSWKNLSQVAAETLSIHQRFYTALALNDLVNEMSIGEVCRKYKVNKGVVQNLQQAASTFAGMVTVFCGRLGWSNLELLLSQFQERLQFGVQRELVDLVRLDSLNGQRARILYNAGIKTISELAVSDYSAVTEMFYKASPFSSNAHGAQTSNRNIWMLGRNEDLTDSQAAQFIVQEARNFIQMELGLADVQFRRNGDAESDKENQSDGKEQDAEGTVEILEDLKCGEDDLMEVGDNNSFSVWDSSIDGFNMVTSDIGRSFRDDSRDSIVTGILNTPRIQEHESPLSIVKFSAALKHSTPVLATDKSNPEESVLLSAKNLIAADKNRRVISENDFDETQFILSEREISSIDGNLNEQTLFSEQNIPGDDASVNNQIDENEVDIAMLEAMTTSFMDVSITLPTETNQALLSESLLAGAAAMVAEGEESSDSENGFSPPILLSSPLNIQRSEISWPITKSISTTSSSSDDEDFDSSYSELTFPTTSLKTEVISVFGKKFKIKKVSTLKNLPKSVFHRIDDSIIGLGLNFYVPTTAAVTFNLIGSRIMGKRHSTSKINDHPPNILALCDGCTATIWTFEWKDKDNKEIRDLMRKFKEKSVPLAILDAKEKFKLLLSQNSQAGMKMNELPELWDPKIAQWLLNFDEDRPITRDDLIAEWMDAVDTAKFRSRRKGEVETWKTEISDALCGWKLMTILREQLTLVHLWTHFVDVESKTLKPLLLMELNGLGVDEVEMERIKERLEYEAAVLELSAYRIAGRPFNLASSKEIRHILRVDLGFGNILTSRNGTGKAVLKKLDHEFANVIIQWRKVTSTLALAVIPFLTTNNRGRIHGYYSHFTATGRTIMSDPSLQLIPRDFSSPVIYSEDQIEGIRHHGKIKFGNKAASLLEKVEKRMGEVGAVISIRNCFRAIPGFLLLSADYSQLELRILAHLCQDPNLIRILNNPGGDVFREIGAQWKEISIENVTDEIRQDAKGITYGIIYGMGSKTLSEQLEVDEAEATSFMRGFMQTYPSIQTFIDSTVKSCRTNGYVETISGRKRYLDRITSRSMTQRAQAERQAVNTRIQGSASDLVKKAMIRINEELTRHNLTSGNFVNWYSVLNSSTEGTCENTLCFPVLNLHDELIFEVKEAAIFEVTKIVRSEMESCLDICTPVVLKVGHSWGKLQTF